MQARQIIKYIRLSSLMLVLLLCFFTTCKTDKGTPDFGSYPTEIGKLLTTKCATPGCHNNRSKFGAAGLSLETWNILFYGENSGASVIPFRPDFSTLYAAVNTFPDLGLMLAPTMPYNKPPLSRDEVILLRDWILQGAPDKDGFVKFSDNALRRKFYVTNQGCDVVTVVDQETTMPMRYIYVGKNLAPELPHMIKVSPDRQYWYVIFISGGYIQRYRTSDDSFDGEVAIGSGNWNSITISSDSKNAYIVDWSSTGKIVHVNLTTMTLTATWSGAGLFDWPHGAAINKTNDTLYVTGQTGNYIYKIPVADPASTIQVSLQQQPYVPPITSSSLDIHQIIFSPDYSKYFVTCQKTNEVRVVKTSNDSVLSVISVGLYPQELSISKGTNYLFVSCPEDTISFPGSRGSIAVIDHATNTLVTKIFAGFQSHGLVVDDAKNLVYVANRNTSTKGPAPHHSSSCGGRNGNLTIIDMVTLQLVKNNNGSDKRIELSVDPYSIDLR